MESWRSKYLAVFKDYTDVSKTYENQKQLDDDRIKALET